MNRTSPLNRRHALLGLASLTAAAAATLACRPSRAEANAASSAAPVADETAAHDRPPGTFDTLEWTRVDSARQRSVPMRLYLPHGARVAQQVPLLLFSHGIGGSRRGYRYLGEHLAAHGVAALHVQHVGSDSQVWTGGSVFGIVGRLQGAAQDNEALNRVHDLRFALDDVLQSPYAGALDAKRVLVAGHSYGANTALLAAGAQVRRDGQALNLRDERLRAAILISAPPFYGEENFAPILGPISVPSLHITATQDVIRIPGYFSGAGDRVKVFEATGSSQKWLAVFAGGSHSMFTDRAGTGGALLNPQVKAATRELALAFVQATLGAGGPSMATSPLQAWPQRHAGLLSRFEAR